jgi:type II secretory pathway component HofQ
MRQGQWFFPGILGSSTNRIDRHNITEILLKVVLNTINQPNQTIYLNYPDNFYNLVLSKSEYP